MSEVLDLPTISSLSYSQIFLLERLDAWEFFSAITAGVLDRHLEAPDISQCGMHTAL